MERIGVFICECGPNIKEAMDLGQVLDFAKSLEGVVFAKVENLLCSAAGKDALARYIKDNSLTRIVIAACSPKEHEATFKKILSEAGLNPYLMQMANIREQCAWVIKDKKKATKKAQIMIRAAVRRVVYHESLFNKEIDCCPDALVVGSGVAGISAAVTLAQKNRKVYVVERLPSVGGRVARYEEVYPELECASCMLEPKLDQMLHDDRIEVMTYSQVTEVLGFYGNFVVKVRRNARSVDMKGCIGCGACIEACPVKVKNEFNENMDQRKAIYIPYAGALPNVPVIDRKNCLRYNGKDCDLCQKACAFGSINYDDADTEKEINVGSIVLATGFDCFDCQRAPEYGYDNIDNVYTALEFERMLSTTGPTGGKVLLKNGKSPQTVAIIHCAGSRMPKYDKYCSGVCCLYSLKYMHLVRKQLAGAQVTSLYYDYCLPGKDAQDFYDKVAAEKGMKFLERQDAGSVEVKENKGEITINYTDPAGKRCRINAEMVILATAMEPAGDAEEVAGLFGISQDECGFFKEEHGRLAPVSTTTEGIFIAGGCQGPKGIQSATVDGQAAAGRVLSRLVPGGKLLLEAMTAIVDKDSCSGCKICIGLCPYKAISYNEKEKCAEVNEVLCRCCGICVASCPSGCITARHFTDREIVSEIEGLLE